MPRTRLLAATAVAVVCGLTPAAPLPAAQAAPGVWTTTLPATAAFDNLSAFPDGTAYVTVAAVTSTPLDLLPPEVPDVPDVPVGGDSTGYLKSTDFGRSWTPMPPPPVVGGFTARNLHVRFATPDIGYATYGNRNDAPKGLGPLDRTLCLQVSNTFRTIDGGKTWSPLCEPSPATGRAVLPVASPLAVGRDGATLLHLGYEDPQGDACEGRGTVHFSGDSGRSWRRFQLPGNWQPSHGARVYDRNTAAVLAYKWTYGPDCSGVGAQNGVFLTTDGGRTYRQVLTCAKQPLCSSVAFVTRTTLVVGKTDGSTTVSTDGGRRWVLGQRLWDTANDAAATADPQLRFRHWVQSFSFADAKHGYASTRGGGTWRTADGGRTWSQEASHECVYHQWGIGENAAFNADRAITGGPAFISARTPAPATAQCHPPTQQLPLTAPDAPVAVSGRLTVHADGTMSRTR